jgi:hypothetical protein
MFTSLHARRLVLLACATVAATSVALPARAGAAAPEGRGYEMVSPVDKSGAEVGRNATVHAAPSGDRIAFQSTGAFAGAVSNVMLATYVAERSPDAWTTTAIDPPQRNFGGFVQNATYALSEDLGVALQASVMAAAPGAVDGNGNVYVRDHATGARSLVATSAEPRLWQNFSAFGATPFSGAARDFSNVVFESTVALVPDAVANRPNVYEFDGGELRLASRLPDGSAPPTGANAGTNNPEARRVSADGKRIYFSVGTSGGSPLYLREDGVETVPLSASQRDGDPPTVQQATFGGASRDGSLAYFTSHVALTNASDALFGESLYRYDADSGELTDLTVAPSGATQGANVNRVLQVSEDGGTVYFAARGALAPGATPITGLSSTNYYVLRDGAITFIGHSDPVATESMPNAWLASPNGRYFAFSSFSRMTAEDTSNAEQCPTNSIDHNPPGACRAVYVYDADTDALRCASCAPATPPVGFSELGGTDYRVTLSEHYPRSVLDDGSVFLETPNALTPADVNGKVDVYRWRDGEATLVSSGQSPQDSDFADATPDGDDIFFRTSESLVRADTDRSYDLYDARLGGGLASQNPPTPPAACAGDDCQGPPTPPPADVRPGTIDTGAPPATARVSLGAISRAQRAALARTGALRLRIKVDRAGPVSARATARVRKRIRTVAGATVRATAPGTVELALRLSKPARGRLARRGVLRLLLTVRQPTTGAADRARLTVRKPVKQDENR